MAKIALVSDIHSNFSAFQAVLEELDKHDPDIWLCLGDIVGYGPEPKECLNEVMKRNMISVLGNHDGGVIGSVSLEHFRNPNRRLIEMTRNMIDTEQLEWLEQLPLKFESEDGLFMAVHASPENPERWEYLESAPKVRNIINRMPQKFLFSGHTHKPALVSGSPIINKVKKDHKFMINPGSVGQPRDNDHRASCGILDTINYTYQNIKVNYDSRTVLIKLESLGFSRREAEQMMLPR